MVKVFLCRRNSSI